MSEKWLGVTVSGRKVQMVIFEYEGDELIGISLTDCSLPTGEVRPSGYRTVYDRVKNYVLENRVNRVAVQSSAAGQHVNATHLRSAELRGVVIAAATQPSINVQLIDRSVISKTFGVRAIAGYLDDEAFWEDKLQGQPRIKKEARNAAMLILAARK